MLEEQRAQIDAIDKQIVSLFEQRTAVVEEVAKIKLANDIPILDQSREDKVIEKVQGYLENPELAEGVADLYQNLMRISKVHQEKWLTENKQK